MAAGNKSSVNSSIHLSTEWLELESDPGLFTLLIQDFGVRGVKVEEVYDVNAQSFQDSVFGFVFLFQWVEERRARKKTFMNEDCFVTEPSILREMFFAHQIVTNSCATHALLSILLNCDGAGKEAGLELGPTLPGLKEFCHYLDPEARGYAIGNMPDLAAAHNRHARPEVTRPNPPPSKRGAILSTAPSYLSETFHFVSFVPIGERLFELDGLKEWPIDHGPWAETEDWTDLFKRIITRRLNEGDGIQFNLMALIPDPLPKLSGDLKRLHTREKELLESAYELARARIEETNNEKEGKKEEMDVQTEEAVKEGGSKSVADNNESGAVEAPDNGSITNSAVEDDKMNTKIKELLQAIARSSRDQEIIGTPPAPGDKLEDIVRDIVTNDRELTETNRKFTDEMESRRRYQVEAERRTHDYDRFFIEYFKSLATHKLLPQRMMEMRRNNRRNHKKGGGKGSKKASSQYSRNKAFTNGDY